MESELWYLVLIPVLFAAGWWARGLDAGERERNSRRLPEAYSRGVAMLMSDRPDKAIDPFIEVVRLDPELIELHHVLGTLFRRRGEFERAIKLHNHLVNREDIPEEDRVKALQALGEDYMTAGLFDRAEETYRRLLRNPTEHLDALRALLEIYCIEHEWTSAIDVSRQLEVQAGENLASEIAHYYCELAEEAVRRKDFELADDHVRHALEKCPESPRAGIAAYLPLVVGRVADALDALGRRDEAVVLLHKALADNGGADVMEEAVKRLAAWEGLEKAGESVVEMLARRPSLSAFSTMMTLRQKERPDDEETKLLATLLQRHGRRFTKYQCSNCGFLASSFSWHCLGCGAWDSFPPRRIEDVK